MHPPSTQGYTLVLGARIFRWQICDLDSSDIQGATMSSRPDVPLLLRLDYSCLVPIYVSGRKGCAHTR